MIFARISSEEDEEQLHTALKEALKPYIYRRLLLIQFSAQGKGVVELASLFRLHPLTIRKYIHAYNRDGIQGVVPADKSGRPCDKSGRPCKLPLTKDQWLDILHQAPATFEELNTPSYNWTLELLARYVKIYHGVTVRPSGIWYILRRHRINMGRSQWKLTSPDPEYKVKRDRVEALKKKRKSDN